MTEVRSARAPVPRLKFFPACFVSLYLKLDPYTREVLSSFSYEPE